MLKCAVPGCNAQEKYLRSGSLHMLDVPIGKDVACRIVWFCHDCSSNYQIQTWRPAGDQIRPRMSPIGFGISQSQPEEIAVPPALLPPLAVVGAEAA